METIIVDNSATDEVDFVGVPANISADCATVITTDADLEDRTTSRWWLLTLAADIGCDCAPCAARSNNGNAGYTKEYVENKLSAYTYTGQLEQGKEVKDGEVHGFNHWQIAIGNHSKQCAPSFKQLKDKFPTGHLEVSRNKRACVNYVRKSDTFRGVRIGNGVIVLPPEKSAATQLSIDLKNEITVNETPVDEILDGNKYPTAWRNANSLRQLEIAHQFNKVSKWKTQRRDNIYVEFISGETGSGKTSYVANKFGYDNLYVPVEDKNAKPFDGYTGQSVLFLDEFDGFLPMKMMLRLLDQFPIPLPARYRDKFAAWEYVYILSNDPITGLYRDVQKYSPRTWDAFLRRVDVISHMTRNNWGIPIVDDEPKKRLSANLGIVRMDNRGVGLVSSPTDNNVHTVSTSVDLFSDVVPLVDNAVVSTNFDNMDISRMCRDGIGQDEKC